MVLIYFCCGTIAKNFISQNEQLIEKTLKLLVNNGKELTLTTEDGLKQGGGDVIFANVDRELLKIGNNDFEYFKLAKTKPGFLTFYNQMQENNLQSISIPSTDISLIVMTRIYSPSVDLFFKFTMPYNIGPDRRDHMGSFYIRN